MAKHPDNNFIYSKTVSSDIEQPLYHQILIMLKQQIESGVLKPGDQLPSEAHLCEKYGVSRTTVRQAFEHLVEQNLIIRRRGKGSFVADRKMQRSLSHLYSFTQDMKGMSLNPSSRVIESRIISSSDEISRLLEIPPDSEVFKLTRVRYANGEAVLLENTLIPYYLCKGIEETDFSASSLYAVLGNQYNLQMEGAVETYESIKLSKETSSLLQCDPYLPGFHVQRIARLNGGIPFEITNSFVRGDKCIFRVDLHTSRKQTIFSREITV